MRKRTARRKVARRAKTRRGGAVGNNNDPSYNASSRMYGGPAPNVSSRMYGGPAPIVNEPNVSSRMYGGPAPIVNEPNVSSRMYGGPAPIVNAAPNQYADVPNVPNANHPPSYTSSSSNMGAQVNSASSSNMGTQSNRVSRSNMETQTNNNTRNITNMTEDQLLQQYLSVYETISSKADAVKITTLLKENLKLLLSPIALYVIGDINTTRMSGGTSKTISILSYVITQNDIYEISAVSSLYGASGTSVTRVLPSEHVYHFSKPLDMTSIRMFQSFSTYYMIGEIKDNNTDFTPRCTEGCSLEHKLKKQFIALCSGVAGQKLNRWALI